MNAPHLPRALSRPPAHSLSRLLLPLVFASVGFGQTTVQPPAPANSVVKLAPFEVGSDSSSGYVATSTLGGTLIRTNLSDVGSAISVYTKDFLDDLGAFDNETLLAFTVNTDVGGVQGTFVNTNSQGEENENFGSGNNNTRIRGLAADDNTLNYFKSDAPWDGYNTDRIDVIRGANSILFGLGSPAGIINASNLRAIDRNKGQLQLRMDEFGSIRSSLDYNHVLSKGVLSARVALLNNDQKFKQRPSFKKDERIYLTTKIAPRFLQTQNSTFKLELAVEKGDVKSNTRRAQPPIDQLSYFFLPNAQGGLEGHTVNRNDPADQRWLNVGFGTPTQRTNPLINTAWGNGTVVQVWDRSAQPVSIFENAINSANSYRIAGNAAVINVPFATGSSNASIQGTVLPVFLNGYRSAAALQGLPFADRYQDRVLTDTSIYDFYRNLLDGNSKREGREWTNGRAELTHSFFDNQLSYNLQYFKESSDFDRYAALGSSSNLQIDAGKLLPDGQPNPNAGKAYTRASPYTGSRVEATERDALRGVLFLEHDFTKRNDGSILRWLGRHFVTGTLSRQGVEKKRADYLSNGLGQDWVQTRLVINDPARQDQFQTRALTLNYFYLSDSLVGKQLGQNLGLSNIGPGTPPVTGTYNYRYFDGDYRGFRAGVDPAATDPVYGRAAQNPNNYRGWTTGPIKLYGAQTDQASRDYLTRVRDFFKEKVDSKAVAWQGSVLKGALVGTYGWREDEYRSWVYTWDEQLVNAVDFKPNLARFEFAPREKTGQASSWSGALHAEKIVPKLPFKASLLYAKGKNTNPDPGRIDVFRQPVLSAAGETTDQSIVLSTRDNKWVLRATRFETSVKNASSSSTLQTQKFLLEQAFWQSFDGVYRTLISKETNYGSIDPVLVSGAAAGTLTAAQQTRYNAQLVNIPRNITASNAWLEFEKRFAQQFPAAVAAWLPAGGTFPGSTASPGMRWAYPENAVLIEDTISKGTEVELVANVTKNWRLAANVSQTKAVRDNIPGAQFAEIINFIYNEFQTDAGRVPINADTNGAPSNNNTPRERFSGLWDAYQVQLQNNGQSVRELSEWRFNTQTNYTFDQGSLKGFSIGGNYRYESPKAIGYGYKLSSTGATAVDLSKMYEDEPHHTFGLTMRYRRKVSNRVSWSIQANITNIFQSGDKVSLTGTQPDGSIRTGMIREGRSWALTNTFDF
jgi:outer membrane receptor protein involved in Fe transport